MLKIKANFIALSLFCGVFSTTLTYASEIPGMFGKMPLVSEVSISPDGETLAAIFSLEGKPVVMTAPFGQHETTPLVSLKSTSDRIESVDWVSNQRLLINASRAEYLAGRFYRIHTMYAVNKDGSNLLEIKNQSAYKKAENSRYAGLQSMYLLNDLADDDDHVLVSAYDERDQGYAVFKVNVTTSKFSKVESAAGGRQQFISNRQGDILFSTVIDKHLLTLEYKKAADQPWKKLKTIDLTGDIDFYPIGFSDDGKGVLINTDYQNNFNHLAMFDLTTAEISKPLYEEPGHDITRTYSKAGRLIGYSVVKDFPEQIFIDPKQRAYNEQIKKLMPDRHSYITSYSENGQRVVIYSVKDNKPGRYLTLDFNTKKAAVWFSQYPQLEKVDMPAVNNIQFTSRDGLSLQGYLTVPSNKNKPAPVILFPHGGPVARDHKAFDPFVQFFSAMGYAVLQVNYRGSSGFGKELEIAGYRQWGKKMQDDLMDALAAVSANPDIDTGRSCMVGASYGGYSTLVASYRDQDKFRCFVSISGISDLPAMLRLDGSYNDTTRAIQKVMIGDFAEDEQSLTDVSAISKTDKINKPLLLIHGVKDTRVSYKQSVALYDVLKRSGKDVTYLEQPDGTHFFDTEQERTEAFIEIERFLQKHLPL